MKVPLTFFYLIINYALDNAKRKADQKEFGCLQNDKFINLILLIKNCAVLIINNE